MNMNVAAVSHHANRGSIFPIFLNIDLFGARLNSLTYPVKNERM